MVKKNNYWWAYVALFSVLVVLSFFCCFNAEWLFGDDYIMMMHSGMGKMFNMGYVIQPKAGRFFPTSYFPWQFLPLLFDGYISAGVHLGVKALMLCAFSLIVFSLFKNVLGEAASKFSVSIALVATLVITFRVYEDCLYLFSTSPVSFLSVAFFIWSCYKFYLSKKTVYEILALFGVNFYIYASEVNFVFPLSFAFLILLFGWVKMSSKERIFWASVLFSSVLYLALYYLVVFRFTTNAYDSGHGSADTHIVNAFKMFYAQKLFWVGLLVVVIRSIKIIRNKEKYNLFFDSLLLSGFAMVLGCFILKLNMTSYYYGACVIMLPSILYFSFKSLSTKLVLVFSLVFLVLYSYKIPSKIELAQNRRESARTSIDAVVSLYDKGYNFIWFWPYDAPKGSDEHNRIYMQTYIQYETHDESFDFIYRGDNELYSELGHDDIVVYTKFGDKFVERPAFFKNMKLLVDTGEITYWQKQSSVNE